MSLQSRTIQFQAIGFFKVTAFFLCCRTIPKLTRSAGSYNRICNSRGCGSKPLNFRHFPMCRCKTEQIRGNSDLHQTHEFSIISHSWHHRSLIRYPKFVPIRFRRWLATVSGWDPLGSLAIPTLCSHHLFRICFSCQHRASYMLSFWLSEQLSCELIFSVFSARWLFNQEVRNRHVCSVV